MHKNLGSRNKKESLFLQVNFLQNSTIFKGAVTSIRNYIRCAKYGRVSKKNGPPFNAFLLNIHLPWEPKTFIFRDYNPYIGGVKPSSFMVLGSLTPCDTWAPTEWAQKSSKIQLWMGLQPDIYGELPVHKPYF